jgi:hypothetical protein
MMGRHLTGRLAVGDGIDPVGGRRVCDVDPGTVVSDLESLPDRRDFGIGCPIRAPAVTRCRAPSPAEITGQGTLVEQ